MGEPRSMTDRSTLTVEHDHVVLPWLAVLPWKQQSIFFSSLRGPDRANVPAIKRVNRWMRSVAQNNADPSKGYMALADLPEPLALCDELEFMPCHYVHHLADGLAVIAYGYREDDVRRTAYAYHLQIAEELFHFIPEPPDIFAWRHRDKRDGVDPEPAKPYDDRPWVHERLPEGYQHA